MHVDRAHTAMVCEPCGATLTMDAQEPEPDQHQVVRRFRLDHFECVADAYPADLIKVADSARRS